MLDTPYAEQQQVLGNTSWDMVDMSYAEHRQVLGNTSWDGAYPNPDENKEWRKANSQQWWKSEACRSVQHEVCLPCEVKKGLSQHTPRTYQKIPQRRPWKKKKSGISCEWNDWASGLCNVLRFPASSNSHRQLWTQFARWCRPSRHSTTEEWLNNWIEGNTGYWASPVWTHKQT